MKIGILTFHRAINYGAVLQAWALQRFLSSQGHDVYIIDYRCKAIEQNYRLINWNFHQKVFTLKFFYQLLSRISHIHAINERNKIFSTFIENEMPLAHLKESSTFDAVICGSDQIWNPILTNGIDNIYTLVSPIFKKVKRIGYAISGEVTCFDFKSFQTLKEIVDSFDAISFRERNLIEKFQPYCAKKISLCVDPTLLIDKNTWERFSCQRIIHEPYIFVYQVVNNKKAYNIAKYIAKQKNLQLIYLNAKFKLNKKEKNISQPIGPKEFVSLIQYADFVLTTSFHGTAMSIVFQKQFAVIETGQMNRQKALLKEVGLENRLIRSTSSFVFESVDFTRVNINAITKESFRFLTTAIQ